MAFIFPRVSSSYVCKKITSKKKTATKWRDDYKNQNTNQKKYITCSLKKIWYGMFMYFRFSGYIILHQAVSLFFSNFIDPPPHPPNPTSVGRGWAEFKRDNWYLYILIYLLRWYLCWYYFSIHFNDETCQE